MTGKKICCFGELLLRFSPEMNGVFIESNTMPFYVGGAELNVARALAKWEVPVTYVTALPGNYLSEEIIQEINAKHIQTGQVKICGERIGAYYLPQGADMKNNAVIYDRNYSSFSTLKPGDINWDDVFQDVTWFHLSAISPALNEGVAALCLEAVQIAAKKNITISIDLNYRARLWQYGKDPQSVMPAIVAHADVIMGNIWSADKLLGIGYDQTLLEDPTDDKYILAANDSAARLMRAFPACTTVANTLRFDAGAGIKYHATLHTEGRDFRSSIFNAEQITDKVGSGDCFMGGLIYGLANKLPPAETIEFAAAAAFSKLFEKGDATANTVNDIKKRMYHG
jgi:2-dehydro-3-deoxygluconokinase